VTAFKAVAWLVLVELVLLVLLVIAAGIVLTHRVVGPLGRIGLTLDRIGQGRFDTRLKLRKGDVLEGLAESINAMAQALHKRDRS
jgi:nitrate/nitrite-specific signal transduction histidine kinase